MSESLPCPAWVFASGSNVHCAKDRSWFGDDYAPLTTVVGSRYDKDTKLNVIGIGSVEIPVRLGPPGSLVHGTLRLHKVLHAPEALCNIIGQPILEDYSVTCSGETYTANDAQDNIVAYFDVLVGLPQLRISEPPIGPQLGPSPFTAGSMYLINAFWSDEERDKIMPDLGPPSP